MTEEELRDLERWKAELEARSAAAEKRHREPPPEHLTADLIDSTPDAGLDDLILEFVDGKRPSGESAGSYRWLDSLPLALQMIWCSIAVEGELNNGGFNQFFFNGTDALAAGAVAGFEAIGAEPFAAVINEAITRASEHASEVARSWGRRSMEDFVGSYRDEIFKDLDDRFSTLYDELDPALLRVAWMRAHAPELAAG